MSCVLYDMVTKLVCSTSKHSMVSNDPLHHHICRNESDSFKLSESPLFSKTSFRQMIFMFCLRTTKMISLEELICYEFYLILPMN